MHKLKTFSQKAFAWFKRAWRSQVRPAAGRTKPPGVHVSETERLDRLGNPSKYLGV